MSLVSGLQPSGVPSAGPRAEPPPSGQLREVLRGFATGVTVITVGRDVPQGMTANAFTSVSLSPPLVLVCVNRAAAVHRAVLGCGSFAVSVLSGRQEHVARYFADHSRPRGRQEFDVVGWSHGPSTGAPLIHGALAWMECELTASHDGGDHSIFVGSVLGGERGTARDALLFFGGAFHAPALRKPAGR
jgi:flavin reductase (DIM6/NTAB) family NADH-FMN oxidoreductase RutF